MSTWMGVNLERGTFPPDLITEDGGYGNGQAVSSSVERLSEIAQEMGLARLDEFIYDPESSDEQGAQGIPWYDPEPALATVRSLIALLEKEVPAAWMKEVRDAQIRRLLRWGFERHWVDQMVPCGDDSSESLSIDRDLSNLGGFWDLLSFEVELMFALREGDRFHFVVTY